jgi:hypothetical protein
MKNVIAIFSGTFLSFCFSALQAQTDSGQVIVTLGRLPPSVMAIGGIRSVDLTKEDILANPILVSSTSKCIVVAYDFSIYGKRLHGPYRTADNELKDEYLQMVHLLPRADIYIENILLKCSAKKDTAPSLLYRYGYPQMSK